MVTDQQIRRLLQLDAQGLPKSLAAAQGRPRPQDRAQVPPPRAAAQRGIRSWNDPGAPAPMPSPRSGPRWSSASNSTPACRPRPCSPTCNAASPDASPDGQLRALQRRIKTWRASQGPAKEVFFDQVHHPGRLCASDFTRCSDLKVTINGQPFDHLIYHFVLTYSNWEAGTVCFSESYESLAEGLQNALWQLGGVPQLHRTDRMSAAAAELRQKRRPSSRAARPPSSLEKTRNQVGGSSGSPPARRRRSSAAPRTNSAARDATLTLSRLKAMAAQSGIVTSNCSSSSITNSAASRLSRLNKSPNSSGRRSEAHTSSGAIPARRATSRRTSRANAAANGTSGIGHSATNSASACGRRHASIGSGHVTSRPSGSILRIGRTTEQWRRIS